MIVSVDQEVPAYESYAAERTRGLYNVGADDGRRFKLDVDIPVGTRELDSWQIGAIVGPSGSGKSSILRELAAEGWTEQQHKWGDAPIIEELNNLATYAKATAALAAVGLGSVPSWLRPRGVLSMGEGFRADMAKLLLETADGEATVLLDEFTSVLDRQVAQVGAGAFARSWRRVEGRHIVLFSCHYDILEWVQPDWWLDTAEGLNEFADDRGLVEIQEGLPAKTDGVGYDTSKVIDELDC